jgi:hypothetical protein
MTDGRQQDLSEVEALLATRQQLTGWLEKLDAAGAKAPAAVRDRVRADYQGRLAQIVQHLRGHLDVISDTLQGLKAQADEYGQLRNEEQETLAEAELRYSVGEYTPDEWERVEKDCSGKLAELDQELERLGGEIKRLEDVQGQISVKGPAGRIVTEAVSAAPPRQAADAPISLVREEPPAAIEPPAREAPEAPEAPRFVPRGGLRTSGPARAIPFPATTSSPPREPAPAAAPVDELTFIKSVTLDPPRGSDRPAPVGAKTLKCGECGALNRPTEWYCERCGAELAAV